MASYYNNLHVYYLLSAVIMESTISQLRKDFQAKVQIKHTANNHLSSASLLTEEELSELENAWIQLITWKQANPVT